MVTPLSIDAPAPGPLREAPVQSFLGPALVARLPPEADPIVLRWGPHTVELSWAMLDDTHRTVAELLEAVLDRRPHLAEFFRHGWVSDARVTPLERERVALAWRWEVPALPDLEPAVLDRRTLLAELRPLLAVPVAAVVGYTTDPRLATYQDLLARLDADQGG